MQEQTTYSAKKKNVISQINILIFVCILFSLCSLFFMLPQENMSVQEKRKLTNFPEFTLKSLKSGDYMDSLDLYVADHFPWREKFISSSNFIKKSKGFQNKTESIYTNIDPIDKLKPLKNNNKKNKETKPINFSNSKGILILNNRAFQLFTNEAPLNNEYDQLIQYYRAKIPKEIRIFHAIVPSSSTFYLPYEYRQYKKNELENIQKSSKPTINQSVFPFDMFDEISKHSKEYIYFKTDHHWTQLGAYYGYLAFCKAASIKPIALTDLQRKNINGEFLGTHYLKTKDERLKNNPDTVYYWKTPTNKNASISLDDTLAFTKVYKQKNISKNKYLVFLGGDKGYMKLTSNIVKNGKSILVIKNSYGNPFVPFLTADYENVIVVDYRYTENSLMHILKKNKIDDLLILNGIFSANTHEHLKRIKDIIFLKDGVKNSFERKKRKKEKREVDSIQIPILDTLKKNEI